jgi:hypothetical protein
MEQTLSTVASQHKKFIRLEPEEEPSDERLGTISSSLEETRRRTIFELERESSYLSVLGKIKCQLLSVRSKVL